MDLHNNISSSNSIRNINSNNYSNMSLDRAQSGDSSLGQPDPADVRAELASAQPHASSSSQGPAPSSLHSPRSVHHRQQQAQQLTRCRFFGSKKASSSSLVSSASVVVTITQKLTTFEGCRAGDGCPYLHEYAPETEALAQPDRDIPGSGNEQEESQSQIRGNTLTAAEGPSSTSGSGQRPLNMARSRERVQKPVTLAQKEDPRNFQLNQLRRRFNPEETTIGNDTSLSFKLAPSDPDFPYELEALKCTMLIPYTYPEAGMPTIRVTNEEIGSELRANVEKAFNTLVDTDIKRKKSGTLLGYMNAIDKQLEQLLSGRALQTFKFVGNVGLGNSDDSSIPKEETSRAPVSISQVIPEPGDKFTSSEKSVAEARRRDEIRQLEARLGRISSFSKSADGTSFTVPLEPNKPERLPAPLKPLQSVKLLVPLLYPLEQCEIEIPGVSKADARSTESAFKIWSASKKGASLSAIVNYLAQNMHIMANRPVPAEEKVVPVVETTSPVETGTETPTETPMPVQASIVDEDVLDRPHVQVVPRPPEWSMPNDGSDSDVSDDYDSELDDSEDEDDEDGGIQIPDLPEPGCQILLSFPFVELYGIELLEVKSLHITVKCDRCREVMDVKNVKAGDGDEKGPVKVESCKKCANYMSISFRKEFVHINSNHAGYLETDGCVAVDMLPSNFIPTCSECSTVYPMPGVIAVRGDTVSATCRECHRKMRFKLPEVKFLTVSRAAAANVGDPGRTLTVKSHRSLPRKRKENLGIVAGQELPRRGRCSHYGKSYRWFRFSCCSKVFSCDKCHDGEVDHPNEHANRMICGLCSREQNYRPEDCGLCHAILVGKAGSGFWEGGKGTRDKARMNRKDPRKYKRRGGTTVGSSAAKRK